MGRRSALREEPRFGHDPIGLLDDGLFRVYRSHGFHVPAPPPGWGGGAVPAPQSSGGVAAPGAPTAVSGGVPGPAPGVTPGAAGG
jgi:hypothetical protein